MDKKPYQLYIGTVKDTGWPIDGRRMVFGLWDYAPDSYSLMDWDEKDDEAVMQTIFQTGVDAGFEDADGLEAFTKTWKAGEYEWPGAFHIDLDKLENVEKIEKKELL